MPTRTTPAPAAIRRWTDPAEAPRLLDALIRHALEGLTIADAPDVRVRTVSHNGVLVVAAGGAAHTPQGSPALDPSATWQIFHLDGMTLAAPGELPLTRAVTRGEVVRDEEWLLRRPDQGDIVVAYSGGPIRDEAGRITGGLVAWRDVTERRLVVEALLATERKARRRLAEVEAIYASAPVGLCVLDADLRIVRVNERLAAMTGRAQATLLGNTPEEAFPGLGTAMMPLLARVLRDQQPLLLEELRLPGRDAASDGRTYVLSALPLSGDGENGVNLVLEDVTCQRDTERALRQVQQSRVLGQLAGGLAHELNNDLAAALGSATLALRSLPPGHPARPQIERSIEAQDEAAGVVRQVLAFSERQYLVPMRIEVNAFLTQVAPLLRRALVQEQALNLVPGPVGYVDADAAQLGEALLNVVLNARDVVGPRGMVTVRVSGTADEVGLEVEDDGPGMPPGVSARAFEPFFTTKEVGVGAGLGLSVVHGIVRQHHGRVVLDTDPGRGTRVRLLLPRCAPPQRQGVMDPPPAAEPSASGTVLVIDDEPLVAATLAELLAMEGLTVLTAASGPEGLEALAGEAGLDVGVVICDLVMPGLSGAEVGARIAVAHPRIRLLFVSGYAREDVLRSGLLPPGAPFLSKPFDLDEVVRLTRALLAARG